MDKWDYLKEKVNIYLVEASELSNEYLAQGDDLNYERYFNRVVAYTKVLQDMLAVEEGGV